jgi:hypothetical protein
MDTKRNDAITRSLTVVSSRREVLQGLAGAGTGFAVLLGSPRGESAVAAKKKRKNKHQQKSNKQRSPSRHVTAEASRGWCRSDPFILIEGVVVDIFCTAPLSALLHVTGPTEIVVAVPVGVSPELVLAGVGFGRGELVRFEERHRLQQSAEGLEVEVEVYVPASSELPIGVELARNLVGILDPVVAEGVTNEWITLGKRLPIATLLEQLSTL